MAKKRRLPAGSKLKKLFSKFDCVVRDLDALADADLMVLRHEMYIFRACVRRAPYNVVDKREDVLEHIRPIRKLLDRATVARAKIAPILAAIETELQVIEAGVNG